MSLNYFYCKVKNLKWDRWQNFTVSCLKALQRLSFYSDLSFKKKEICSAFLECNVFTTNLRELLVCLVFFIQGDTRCNCCTVVYCKSED